MAGLLCKGRAGNTSGNHVLPTPQDNRIALFLKAELFAALQAKRTVSLLNHLGSELCRHLQ
ncbi:hypothetical protein SynWH8103_01776 [Synechococcus sp. WH 8103]|nr:hypothetical protein SynWH8103_01776 [Synechococcus sp. WH 8103]